MEPISSFKRNSGIDYEQCTICQKDKADRIVSGGELGFVKIKECAQERLKRGDPNRDCIDRVLSCATTQQIVWHKGCYSTFTSKSLIARIKEKEATTSQPSCSNEQKKQLRSKVSTIDWSLCLFCQVSRKETLHSIESFGMSNKIMEAVPYNHKLHVALSGISDLIAAEGKYHLKCYSKFLRETAEMKNTAKNCGVAFSWLTTGLSEAASRGHILDLNDVFEHYKSLCQDSNETLASSFMSRRSSFKSKLQDAVDDVYEFHVLQKSKEQEKTTVLVPKQFSHIPISQLLSSKNDEDDDDGEYIIPLYKPGDDIFLSLIHVALKLRSDILCQPSFQGFKVTEKAAVDCMPDSLYMFLKVLYGGQDVLQGNQDFEDADKDEDEHEEDDEEDESVAMKSVDEANDVTTQRMLCVGQDLVYGISKGKKWTPKHVGLGSLLHQSTRSKTLVHLFHRAGHVISYRNVIQVDTALAEETLRSLNSENGAIVPDNLVPGRFVHFSTDNIDILDASLDGKDTFHATQVTAWQRGPASVNNTLENLCPAKTKLDVPDVLMDTIYPQNLVNSPEPKFEKDVNIRWYKEPNEPDANVSAAKGCDMAFIMKRRAEDPRTGWSQYNELLASNPPVTTIGYMPIILNPAHEYDTLNTVIVRCKHIAEALGQKHVVITADEALFSRLMELKWSQGNYDFLIPRLGGLHTSLNYMKAIGQHFQSSGLLELWTDSSLLGAKTAERVLSGKEYEKGMRAHKITYQALWEILLPQLLEYLSETNADLKQRIEQVDSEDDDTKLQEVLVTEDFQGATRRFVQEREDNPNFILWFTYLEMVSILLMFTRAHRDGLWKLHLASFRMMLPYFHFYGHTNYAKWGAIYLAQMNMLPEEVYTEFLDGNFVVKASPKKFNQVDPDHSQEWINGTAKKSGGIVGITRNMASLGRWALSFNFRCVISNDTKAMFGIGSDSYKFHKEANESRKRKDTSDEARIRENAQRFDVFSKQSNLMTTMPKLTNIATKDQATEEITESLVTAVKVGQEQLHCFVLERLLPQEEGKQHKRFHETLKRHRFLTFANLYEVAKSDQKGVSMKVDRSILQRLIISFEAGRKVDLETILSHELLPVPIALSEMDGVLRTGQKSLLMDELCKRVSCRENLLVKPESTLIVDGQALVIALGSPQSRNCKTFRDFARHFTDCVFQHGSNYERIDVVFDRYEAHSIKEMTRKRRKKGKPIRKIIETPEVPVPQDWQGFLCDPSNKADLAKLLSNEIIRTAPEHKCVITAGGLQEPTGVLCNKEQINVDALRSTHEEADTRLVLHCLHTNSPEITVWSRDTDVLLLLLAHFPEGKKVYMKAGTSKKQKFIPINDVLNSWNLTTEMSRATLLAFHALTGSDTTSFLAGHTKKTGLYVYLQNSYLLSDLGRDQLTQDTIARCEEFVCKLYNVPHNTTNIARVVLFKRETKPEYLPPTSEALLHHIKRSHLQSMIWLKANILPPGECGWKITETGMQPVLMTRPAVPDCCLELIKCNCTTRCATRRCGCRKSGLKCTGSCRCQQQCLNINN